MRNILFFILFLVITNVAHVQEPNWELDISNFGSIIVLINNSSTNSGIITFEKSRIDNTITTTYRYEDNLTSIRVESHVHENSDYNGEHIYFDTQSPDFPLFGIKVGITREELTRSLGQLRLLSEERRGNSTVLHYVPAGYNLLFYITNNRVTRIIYNPGL